MASPLFATMILSLALLLNVSAAALGGRKDGPSTGGWQPIKDPKDLSVVEIGKFAVTEHNKQAKESLIFMTVLSGETQVVEGTNYKLVLMASNGGAAWNYEAVVWDKPWQHFKQLTSFRRMIKNNV